MKFTEIKALDGGDTVATAVYENGATIQFSWDNDTESPREWDNVGTMCMWHRRYDLPQEGEYNAHPSLEDFFDWCADGDRVGGVDKNCSGREAVESLGVEWVMMWGEYYLDNMNRLSTQKWQDRLVKRMVDYVNANYVWRLVGMYDHSGLSFSHVGSYKYGGWDSGVVGCHYVSHEKLKDLCPSMTKAQRVASAMDELSAEMKTYDLWQRGNVVSYHLEDANGEFIDSRGGFITDKYKVADLIKEVADYLPHGYEGGLN